MERTVWIVALALAAVASVSCRDSTPNYISFDAQAPARRPTRNRTLRRRPTPDPPRIQSIALSPMTGEMVNDPLFFYITL